MDKIKHYWILALLILPLCASAEVYQWRDSAGKVHYSDTKPAQGAFKDISQRLDQVNIDRSHALRKGVTDVFTPMGSVEKQWLKEQKRQLMAQAKETCIEEQRVMSLLQGPVRISDAQGEVMKVSEAQRLQREQKQASKLQQLGCI